MISDIEDGERIRSYVLFQDGGLDGLLSTLYCLVQGRWLLAENNQWLPFFADRLSCGYFVALLTLLCLLSA